MANFSIRTDVFAVKSDERNMVGWSYVYMTLDKGKAEEKMRAITGNRSLGINRLAKIVHPSQFIVDEYTALGNKIE